MSNHCLKVSYCGLLQHIECAHLGNNEFYGNIIHLIMEIFSLPAKYKEALLFSISGDYKLNKETFEYYLQLFPCPESTIYLRLDWSKITDGCLPEKIQMDNEIDHNDDSEEKTSFRSSKRSNIVLHSGKTMSVAVHRKNCFIGSWPEQQVTTLNLEQKINIISYSKKSHKRRLNTTMNKYKIKSHNSAKRLSIRL